MRKSAYYKVPSILDSMYSKLNYINNNDVKYNEENNLMFLKKIRNSYCPHTPSQNNIIDNNDNDEKDEKEIKNDIKEIKQNNMEKMYNPPQISPAQSRDIIRSSFYVGYTPNMQQSSMIQTSNFQTPTFHTSTFQTPTFQTPTFQTIYSSSNIPQESNIHNMFSSSNIPQESFFDNAVSSFINNFNSAFPSSFNQPLTEVTMNHPFNLNNISSNLLNMGFPSEFLNMQFENVKQPLTQEAFNNISDVKYINIKNFGETKDDQCSICLTEFEDDDNVKYTECCHFFHPNCLGEWTKQSHTCPICRKSLGAHTSLI